MSSETSVIRRYTPPTCTLEISGKDSPLSRWMGRSTLKNVRFKLSFDDPRVGEDRWVTVRGDRIQLQSLCDAVTSYVQKFLHQSSNLVNRALAPQGEGTADTADTATADTATADFVTAQPAGNFSGIYLQPRGMLSHELHLGTLASEDSGSSIPLSAVQLADLASALDEYSADVTALPILNRQGWASNPPAWGKIAAVSLLAIGLSTTAIKFFEPQSPSTQTASTQAPPSSSDQRLAVQPLPSSPSPSAVGPLPPGSPLPLGSLPTTQVPEQGIATPPAPQQSPDLKVTEKAAPGSQTTAPGRSQVQIPTVDVPEQGVAVAPIPKQAAADTARAGSAAGTAAKASEDPAPPAPDAEIAAAPRPTAPTTLSRSAAATAEQQQPARDISAYPQVGEIKGFLQSNWKPTPQLKDEAVFRLALNPDGTVRTLLTVNQAAIDYSREIDPLFKQGAKIASPSKDGQPSIVQIFLNPSGEIRVFPLQ